MDSHVYHGVKGEEEIARVIWKIMEKHYPGAVNPKNPSLMAQRLFAIARAMYDDIEIQLDREYERAFQKKRDEIENLEAEIRELKGLPPLPPIPTA